MRVDVNMKNGDDEFNCGTWWAKTPEFVVDALQKQLEAASAIWPELKRYSIVARPDSKARGGKAGGAARAAALPPSRRSEIASEAAKARWDPLKQANNSTL